MNSRSSLVFAIWYLHLCGYDDEPPRSYDKYDCASCRVRRRSVLILFSSQEVMKGVQMMYDITKFRRPSAMFDAAVPDGPSGFPPTSPSTPALSVYTIDDEFNLPVSVAFVILVVYIVIGAIVFCVEEGWGFFESFYFVFISMSTIGFGDFVPRVRIVGGGGGDGRLRRSPLPPPNIGTTITEL